MRNEHRLKLSESRALRKIFGRKTGEVRGDQRRLHNEELRDFQHSPKLFRGIK